jgi:hypothetical protein
LRHAYEEALDMAIYLRRAMDDMDAQAAVELAAFERRHQNPPGGQR